MRLPFPSHRFRRAGLRFALASLAFLAVLLLALQPRVANAEPPQPAQTMPSLQAAPTAPDAHAGNAGGEGTPHRVVVGLYINDIQEVSFPTHSYAIDLYVWFRWKDAAANPSKSMEFMNRFQPYDHQRDLLTEEPKAMPDGTFYSVVREQGQLATKFNLERYPFDRQNFRIEIEDTLTTNVDQIYVPDKVPVLLNPRITLPGFRVGQPVMKIVDHDYHTNFGDLTSGAAESYSRVIVEIPVARELVTVAVKAFLPVFLIIVCSTLIFFIMPSRVDGRIGLGITALLTLVALQLTATSTLPEVGYLMLIDKIYLASYAFIIAALWRVVATSWSGEDGQSVQAVARRDHWWAAILLLAYIAALALSAAWTFRLL
ncbi:hypothetical protein DLM45_14175 [Hyphomicrobium methylovorum]|uniref:hypothetical protein n=1 Tax=Hyphomicrobium methylovorum TaxID=84 RepID=UPI0015E6B94B|nr:hypothetical protein [Hyphomicrobium methylovorum]MBA2127361.1 hypothetical protein [Hyphomicrobium methylovorum]